MFPCEIARYIAGFSREARKSGPFFIPPPTNKRPPPARAKLGGRPEGVFGWATVLHGWVWRDGGPWFGVPISNYLGWYATVFTIYLLFALYLSRRPAPLIPVSSFAWWPAILFYALCACGNVLQTIPSPIPTVVHDPAGTSWRVAEPVLPEEPGSRPGPRGSAPMRPSAGTKLRAMHPRASMGQFV